MEIGLNRLLKEYQAVTPFHGTGDPQQGINHITGREGKLASGSLSEK